MTSQISRRSVAKGTAWSIPAITLGAPAPAVAASACATIVKGQPLPASAFQATYIMDTRETFGALTNRQVAVDFGFRVTAAAAACGVTSAITSVDGGGTSRFTLSNGKTYDATNGLPVPANGTAGTTDTGCQSGVNGTQACGTTGASPYSLSGATSTTSTHVTAVSLVRSVTVSGYGTTILYLNGSGFGATPGSSDSATVLSATAAPLF